MVARTRADTDSRVLRFISAFKERLAASNRSPDQPLRILDAAASKAVTPLFSHKPFQTRQSPQSMSERKPGKGKVHSLVFRDYKCSTHQENLNEPSAAFTQQYDAIFCVGLLYHLRQPAQFLARAAQAAGFLWLSTIFCAEPEATVVEGDYRGRLFGEAVEHPLSGVNPQSFQPTIGPWPTCCGQPDSARSRFCKNRYRPVATVPPSCSKRKDPRPVVNASVYFSANEIR